MNHRPGIQEQVHDRGILRSRLEAEVGDANGAVDALDIKAILHADGETVQGSVDLARTFEMGVEEAGARQGRYEERLGDTVGELVDNAGAAAECGRDSDSSVPTGTEGREKRGGSWVRCYSEIERGEPRLRVGENTGLSERRELVPREEPFRGKARGNIGEFAVADQLPLRLFGHD